MNNATLQATKEAAIRAAAAAPDAANISNYFTFDELKESFCESYVDYTATDGENEVLLNLWSVPFMRTGNFSLIQGCPKAGKSFLCSIVAAAAVSGSYEGFATPSGKPLNSIIYFDTEQSQSDARKLTRRILKMASHPIDGSMPPNFENHSLRQYTFHKAREVVNWTLQVLRPQLVIIDGITDLVNSPNNEEESIAVVEWLYQLSEKTGSHIMVVIHENAGVGEKARGHIGSELERKCETSMRIKRSTNEPKIANEYNKDERHMVAFRLTRSERPADFYYTVDSEGIPHTSITTADDYANFTTLSQTDIDRDRIEPLFNDVESYTFGNLRSALVKTTSLGESGARKLIERGVKSGILNNVNGTYTLK